MIRPFLKTPELCSIVPLCYCSLQHAIRRLTTERLYYYGISTTVLVLVLEEASMAAKNMLAPATATQLRLNLFRHARCPDCGGPLVHGEGCATCPVCGYSRCG